MSVLKTVTARYSKGSLFLNLLFKENFRIENGYLQLVIPKVRYSKGSNKYYEGSLFRRSVIPKVR